MGQYYRGNSLAQCWPIKIRITLQIIFLCKVVHRIWINIVQVTFLCNAGTCRLRQHCIGSFPAKLCLYALGKHCTSNYLVQCCLRCVWTVLTGQHVHVIFLCNFDPERSGHHCRLFSSAKLFVDCAMIGGKMIDPLTAGK